MGIRKLIKIILLSRIKMKQNKYKSKQKLKLKRQLDTFNIFYLVREPILFILLNLFLML